MQVFEPRTDTGILYRCKSLSLPKFAPETVTNDAPLDGPFAGATPVTNGASYVNASTIVPACSTCSDTPWALPVPPAWTQVADVVDTCRHFYVSGP